jgi:proteasome lid subunit RPN8/RPN11
MIPNPDLSIFDEGLNNEERCAIVFVRADCTTYIVEVPNRAEDKKRYFAIVKSDIDSIDSNQSDTMIGVVHTHPYRFPRRPSMHDIASIREGLIGMVYHPSSGSIVWYDRKGIVQEQLKRRR